MLFLVKVLVSGFRTPLTLHQVPETLFLNGKIKEFVYYKKTFTLYAVIIFFTYKMTLVSQNAGC